MSLQIALERPRRANLPNYGLLFQTWTHSVFACMLNVHAHKSLFCVRDIRHAGSYIIVAQHPPGSSKGFADNEPPPQERRLPRIHMPPCFMRQPRHNFHSATISPLAVSSWRAGCCSLRYAAPSFFVDRSSTDLHDRTHCRRNQSALQPPRGLAAEL